MKESKIIIGMKQLKIIFIAVAVLLFVGEPVCNNLFAQNKILTIGEKKELLKKANQAYKQLNYSVASNYYEKYLQANAGLSTNDILYKLADSYWQIRKYDAALREYKQLFPSGNGTTREQQLHIAELYSRIKDYVHASQWLSGIDGYQAKADVYNDGSQLKSMMRDSLNWHLSFLNINTPYREFSPLLTDSLLYFTSDRPNWQQKGSLKKKGTDYERLWKMPVSKVHIKSQDNVDINRDTNSLAEPVKGFDKIKYNVGIVSVDNNHHFYFSANYSKSDSKGIIRLRLLEGVYSPSGSIKITALPFGDSKSYSVIYPTVNGDGTLLVFSSNKTDGAGGYDLYYAQRKDVHQHWGAAKRFGANVNTVGNEVYPTITSNGYLYYSSDILPGLGGLDIYRIPLEDALNQRDISEHLSYPINSSADDFGWTQDATGLKGYFTSDRLNNEDNIYGFYYKPYNKVRIISGYTLDEQSKMPISGVTIFLLNPSTGKIYIARTDQKGRYEFSVNPADKVIVKAMKKELSSDFLISEAIQIDHSKDTITTVVQDLLLDNQADSKNENITQSEKDSEQLHDSTMKTIQNRMYAKQNFKINSSWKLNDNVYYDFDKADIRNDAKPILDSLITMLKEFPLRIEIDSYTDNRGTSEYNDLLSERRAKSVVTYLVNQGIASDRVVAKSFGKRHLLVNCGADVPCSEHDHQLNRRTEVKIIGYLHKEKRYKFDLDKYKTGQTIDRTELPKDFFDN